MKEHVQDARVPKCEGCGGYVKPDIVFFGEQLPESFFTALTKMTEPSLLIIMGTSLKVHPFASLAGMVRSDCPRVLINLERVGNIGSRIDDVVLQMECDEGVKQLCSALGDDWVSELDRLWAETEKVYTPKKVDSTPKVRSPVNEEDTNNIEDRVKYLAELLGDKLKVGPDVSQSTNIAGTTASTSDKPTAKPTTVAKSTVESSSSESKEGSTEVGDAGESDAGTSRPSRVSSNE